ncbi:MAG: diaminopimelate decarboxylase, partial [Alphaproteobacteria bacterium]
VTPGLSFMGIAVHIGSQIQDLAPFASAYSRLAELVASLRAAGHTVTRLDLGGGFPASYDPPAEGLSASGRQGAVDLPTPEAIAGVARDHLADLGCEITIEPGRALVAEAGCLVTRVLYVKETESKRFAIVDGAMNDLIRPTLYGARHPILVDASAGAPDDTASIVCDVVGPVCETGDYLAEDISLPPHRAGDLLAVMSAGAYGAVMASTYNSRPLVPEVMVHGQAFAVVRPRGRIADLIAAESLPPWLDPGSAGP